MRRGVAERLSTKKDGFRAMLLPPKLSGVRRRFCGMLVLALGFLIMAPHVFPRRVSCIWTLGGEGGKARRLFWYFDAFLV